MTWRSRTIVQNTEVFYNIYCHYTFLTIVLKETVYGISRSSMLKISTGLDVIRQNIPESERKYPYAFVFLTIVKYSKEFFMLFSDYDLLLKGCLRFYIAQ